MPKKHESERWRASLEELCNEELKKQIDLLSRKHFQKPFLDHACYNGRLRTTGGRYIPQKRTIEVNPKYVHEMPYNEVIGIIKHELCHYHLHIEGKPFGHRDRAFKELLTKTNAPRFCKPLPSNVKNQTFHIYACNKCKMTYKRKRRVNVERVRCGRCNDRIVYKTFKKGY